MTAPDIRTLSSPALAYLGDSVLEVQVRQYLVSLGLSTAAHLNAASLSFVRAGAQAEAMTRLLPLLTEKETEVYRRGRNNVHSGVPKSATVSEYRMATGMECLFAYLYLSGNTARIETLFAAAYPPALMDPRIREAVRPVR